MVTDNSVGYSDIELITAEWLTKRNILFEFQVSMLGGRFSLGGAVIDFLFPDRYLAWRLQGDYFHTGVEKEGSDAIQRALLESMGYQVVDLWGSDILDPDIRDDVLEKALQGEETLRS